MARRLSRGRPWPRPPGRGARGVRGAHREAIDGHCHGVVIIGASTEQFEASFEGAWLELIAGLRSAVALAAD